MIRKICSVSLYISGERVLYSSSHSLYSQRPRVYRNNLSMISECDGLESDRDHVRQFHGKTDENEALDRERARCSMARKISSQKNFAWLCTVTTGTWFRWFLHPNLRGMQGAPPAQRFFIPRRRGKWEPITTTGNRIPYSLFSIVHLSSDSLSCNRHISGKNLYYFNSREIPLQPMVARSRPCAWFFPPRIGCWKPKQAVTASVSCESSAPTPT